VPKQTGSTTTTAPPRSPEDADAALTEAINSYTPAGSGSGVGRTYNQDAESGARQSSANSRYSPIGVDFDYNADATSTPQRTGLRQGDIITEAAMGGSVLVRPAYFEDDLLQFGGYGEEWVSMTQQQLIAAGLLPEGASFSKGIWDTTSQSAFANVLAYANLRGITWEQAMADYVAMGADRLARIKGPGAQGPKFTPRLSNPEDLKKLFRQVATQNLGGKFVDDAQMESMVAAYQQIELSSQRQQFSAQVGGGQSTDTEQPDTYAERALEELDPAGTQATKFSSYVGVLEQLLGAGGMASG
jgi:hypothetical protein